MAASAEPTATPHADLIAPYANLVAQKKAAGECSPPRRPGDEPDFAPGHCRAVTYARERLHRTNSTAPSAADRRCQRQARRGDRRPWRRIFWTGAVLA